MKLPKSVFSSAWTHQSAEVWGSQVAKLAGYDAGRPTVTRAQHSRLGSNPNSVTSQIERVRMEFNAEYLAKNAPFAIGYLNTRGNYCSPLGWMPDTGDAGLNIEIRCCVDEWMKDGGMNCSAYKAFARTAHAQLPIRGDSALVWFRDATRLRVMEAGGDQIGELNVYGNPAYVSDTGLSYFSGMYFDRYGIRQAFRIYSKGTQDYFFSPNDYPSTDVIYFQDNGLFPAVRGITKFHGTIATLTKSDQLFQFGLEAAGKQAKTGAVVRNEQGGPAGELSYDAQVEDDGRIVYLERAQDGSTTEYQYNGDAYEFMRTEAPGEALIKGCEYADERSCLSLGFPFSFLVNARDVGGAPSRLEISKAGKEVERIRKDCVIDQFSKMVYVIIMDAVDRGQLNGMTIQNLGARRLTKGSPKFPNLPTADAFRETQDDIASSRAGIETRASILSRTNEDWPTVLAANQQEAMDISRKVQDANRLLKKELSPVDFQPYEGDITAQDIAQNSDNPQQSAAGEAIAMGQPGISPEIPSSGKGQVTDNPPNITRGVFSDFDESKHPRAEDGKFGEGSGKLSESSRATFKKEWQLDDSEIDDLEKNGRKSSVWKDYIDKDILERNLPEVNDLLSIHPQKGKNSKFASAVETGDLKTASEMIHKEAMKNGFDGPYYHGTAKEYDEVDPSKFGSGVGGPGSKSAFFLTEDKELANQRGPIVKQFYVKADRVKRVSEKVDTYDAGKIIDDAKSSGNYDAVHFEALDDSDTDSRGRKVIAMIGGKIASGDPSYSKPPSERFAPGKSAQLSAYIGDVLASDLPQSTQNDIANILGTNGTTGKLKLIKYGMVPSELEKMADSHNLESAQHNIRNVSNRDCSAAVHANAEKHVLINNGKIVDGHHYLARALKGGVTKSLPVIDLTPSRFQGAEWDESKHPRADDGEFGSGGGVNKSKAGVIEIPEDKYSSKFDPELFSLLKSKLKPGERLMWHGGADIFPKLQLGSGGNPSSSDVISVSSKRSAAHSYGEKVGAYAVALKNPFIVDYGGGKYDEEKLMEHFGYDPEAGSIDDWLGGKTFGDWLKGEGHDGAIVKNIVDYFGGETETSGGQSIDPHSVYFLTSSKQARLIGREYRPSSENWEDIIPKKESKPVGATAQ